MASTSFTRSIPLAGPGRITRSLSNAKLQTVATSERAESSSVRRPNKAELEAKLAGAKLRAQARQMSEHNGRDLKAIGLGFPLEVFQYHARIIAAKNVAAQAPAVPQGGGELSPIAECPTRSSSCSSLSSLGSVLSSPTLPFSPELALARLPSYQFERSPLRVPPPTPVMQHQSPSQRPRLSMMPTYASPLSGHTNMADAHARMPSLGLGLGIFVSPIAHQSPFLGPPTGPRRPVEHGASAQDPIVSPRELMQRNFPLTPGAPIRREFIEGDYSTMPGAPVLGCLPTDEGMQFYVPTGLITPVGLGITMDFSPSSESEFEY